MNLEIPAKTPPRGKAPTCALGRSLPGSAARALGSQRPSPRTKRGQIHLTRRSRTGDEPEGGKAQRFQVICLPVAVTSRRGTAPARRRAYPPRHAPSGEGNSAFPPAE